jgi:hypothetical protein
MLQHHFLSLIAEVTASALLMKGQLKRGCSGEKLCLLPNCSEVVHQPAFLSIFYFLCSPGLFARRLEAH